MNQGIVLGISNHRIAIRRPYGCREGLGGFMGKSGDVKAYAPVDSFSKVPKLQRNAGEKGKIGTCKDQIESDKWFVGRWQLTAKSKRACRVNDLAADVFAHVATFI